LQSELTAVLSHTTEALGAKGGVLLLAEADHTDLRPVVKQGASLGKDLKLVEGLAAGAQRSRSPIIIRDLEQVESHEVRSLLVAPLRTEEQFLGCLVLWSASSNTFSRRQANLVDIVTGQMALLIENHRLYLQGEHQVALDERARLAREIHDGLAQSLGYLKLRTGQIINWLQLGDSQRAEAGLIEVRQLLDEAYVDAREAIDGLRLAAGDGNIDQWIEEILAEFELLSGIPAYANPAPLDANPFLEPGHALSQGLPSSQRTHAARQDQITTSGVLGAGPYVGHNIDCVGVRNCEFPELDLHSTGGAGLSPTTLA
jgi:nitrate/nitrite-specific signal transduction histidine kinase